jgi:hypothetical protein
MKQKKVVRIVATVGALAIVAAALLPVLSAF